MQTKKEYWDAIQYQGLNDKDTQDWLDIVGGKEVPDANPYNKEYALMVRKALLPDQNK